MRLYRGDTKHNIVHPVNLPNLRLAEGGNVRRYLTLVKEGRAFEGRAGFAIIERLIGQYNLTNLQELFVDLPRDFMYAGLLFRLAGTFTVAGGTTNGTLDDLNPWSYLRKIELEGSGGGEAVTIKNYKGYHAARLHHLMWGVEPARLALGSAGVAAGVAWNAEIPVWFALPGAQMPPEISRATLLNPARYSKLTLKLTPGDDTNFVRGGDRTETVNSPTIDVIALQAVNIAAVPSKPLVYRETHFLRDTTAALATDRRLSQPLPTGNRYRALLLISLNEASNAFTPIDDQLGDIRFQVGTVLARRYTTPLQIAQTNKRRNTVADAANIAGLTAASNSQNPSVGFYLMDFAEGGRVEGLLDSRNLPNIGVPLDLLHDIETASARTLEVVTCEVIG